jgi:hypothetical protein
MELNFKDRMEASGEDLFVVFGVGNAGIDLCLGSDEGGLLLPLLRTSL